MDYPKPLQFHEYFSVVVCRTPDYCYHCNKVIRQGEIKVIWKTRQYHSRCLEDYGKGRVKVNTETMQVEINDG